MLLRHFVDSVIITGAAYAFLAGLALLGINLVFALTYSWVGVLFTFLLVFAEVVWNRL
jgi:hypothetical protein